MPIKKENKVSAFVFEQYNNFQPHLQPLTSAAKPLQQLPVSYTILTPVSVDAINCQNEINNK